MPSNELIQSKLPPKLEPNIITNDTNIVTPTELKTIQEVQKAVSYLTTHSNQPTELLKPRIEFIKSEVPNLRKLLDKLNKK